MNPYQRKVCVRLGMIVFSWVILANFNVAFAQNVIQEEYDSFTVNSPIISRDTQAISAEPTVPQEVFVEDKGPSFFNPYDNAFRARAGVSYFDLPDDSEIGGSYGFDYSRRVYGPWGGYMSFDANSISRGTQFMGTLGIIKRSGISPDNFLTRFGFGFFFDQFSDTRVDEFYVSQFRLHMGYMVTHQVAVGLRYAEPISRDQDVIFVSPGFGATPGFIRPSQFWSGYLSFRKGPLLLTGEVGYRDKPNTTTFGAGGRYAMSNRLGTYSYVTYETRGVWAANVGLEFRIGNSPCNNCSTCSGCGPVHTPMDSYSGDIVRGQPVTDSNLGTVTDASAGGILDSFVYDDGGSWGEIFNDATLGTSLNYNAAKMWNDLFLDGCGVLEHVGRRSDIDRVTPKVAEILKRQRAAAAAKQQAPPEMQEEQMEEEPVVMEQKMMEKMMEEMMELSCEELVAKLIAENPKDAFAVTQALFDMGRFDECCEEAARQLEMPELCGPTEDIGE